MDSFLDRFPKFTFLPAELDPPSLEEIERRLSKNIITDSTTFMLAFSRAEAERAEQREWKAVADAKSAKLKEKGNAAFVNGDFKTAYIIYTACGVLSCENPVYTLNRAAVALKLRMYEVAESDARLSIDKADAGYGDASFSRAKAYFRRGQAWFHLGNWDKAAEDYDTASALQPDNRQIVHRIEDLRKLRKTTCPCDNNHAWVWQQGKVCLEDVFGDPEEFYKRAGLED